MADEENIIDEYESLKKVVDVFPKVPDLARFIHLRPQLRLSILSYSKELLELVAANPKKTGRNNRKPPHRADGRIKGPAGGDGLAFNTFYDQLKEDVRHLAATGATQQALLVDEGNTITAGMPQADVRTMLNAAAAAVAASATLHVRNYVELGRLFKQCAVWFAGECAAGRLTGPFDAWIESQPIGGRTYGRTWVRKLCRLYELVHVVGYRRLQFVACPITELLSRLPTLAEHIRRRPARVTFWRTVGPATGALKLSFCGRPVVEAIAGLVLRAEDGQEAGIEERHETFSAKVAKEEKEEAAGEKAQTGEEKEAEEDKEEEEDGMEVEQDYEVYDDEDYYDEELREGMEGTKIAK